MLKILLPAAVIAILAVPVAASPITPPAQLAIQAPDSVEQVQMRRRHHFRHPPRGWHRFGKRPRDWRRRGCIRVGSGWFCR